MNAEELIIYLSQVNDKPFRTIDDLKEKYNDEYCPFKLKANIKKILDCIEKWEGHPNNKVELEKKQKGLSKLADILVSFGGMGLSLREGFIEEDLDKLLDRGQLWVAHGVEKMKGQESQCHKNSVYLWDANKDKNVYLATGYALTEDGIWRQHSWCLHKKSKSVSVVETTSPKRIAYFGYAMTSEEAVDFYYDNE